MYFITFNCQIYLTSYILEYVIFCVICKVAMNVRCICKKKKDIILVNVRVFVYVIVLIKTKQKIQDKISFVLYFSFIWKKRFFFFVFNEHVIKSSNFWCRRNQLYAKTSFLNFETDFLNWLLFMIFFQHYNYYLL